MITHKIETKLTENGKLMLENLPFKEGDSVQIIIPSTKKNDSYPLHNKQPYRYDEPFKPAFVNIE